jgi:ribonuclease HIII
VAIIGTAHVRSANYFVAVGVVLFENTRRQLVALGVRPDMPDSEIRRIELLVRNACGFDYVEIYPRRYNELLHELREPRLVAWAHASAIERLLRLGADVDTVIIDESIELSYVSSRLRRRWPEVNVRSVPRSQSVTMAAASVIARSRALGSGLRSPAASR